MFCTASGHLGKARLHLLRRAQIELLLGVPQPLGVGQLRLRADADQAVVRVRVALLDVMHVVRRDQLQAELLRPRNQVPVDLGLLRQAVVLQFQVEVLRAERLLEPVNRLARPGQLVLLNPLRDFARQAAGERDQPLLVRRQQFLVDARLVVIALQVRRGGELDQVLVAGFVLGQQHEVVIHVPPAGAGLLLEPAAGRDIDLAADDRLDAFLARRLVEINRPVKHAVIGDRQRRELQLMRLVHQPVQPASPIEQRILGVQMKMDKFRVRHEQQFTAGSTVPGKKRLSAVAGARRPGRQQQTRPAVRPSPGRLGIRRRLIQAGNTVSYLALPPAGAPAARDQLHRASASHPGFPRRPPSSASRCNRGTASASPVRQAVLDVAAALAYSTFWAGIFSLSLMMW